MATDVSDLGLSAWQAMPSASLFHSRLTTEPKKVALSFGGFLCTTNCECDPMMQSANEDLIVSESDSITTIRLNRAEKRNALSLELLSAVDQTLQRVASSKTSRVVILRADGPVFSSGHDLKQMVARTRDEYEQLFEQCSVTMQRLRNIPQPVIARVQGLATAAGCQLVASCDLVVAANNAWFATPGVKIGLFCTTPMVPLVRNLPPKIAMEMLLTGNPLSAQRAYELGFINRVVSEDELDSTVHELAEQICSASSLTVAIGKAAFYQQLALSEAEAYKEAVAVMTDNSVCADAQEGITSFLEKRSPNWKGR